MLLEKEAGNVMATGETGRVEGGGLGLDSSQPSYRKSPSISTLRFRASLGGRPWHPRGGIAAKLSILELSVSSQWSPCLQVVSYTMSIKLHLQMTEMHGETIHSLHYCIYLLPMLTYGFSVSQNSVWHAFSEHSCTRKAIANVAT
jgi:hypothetical protein